MKSYPMLFSRGIFKGTSPARLWVTRMGIQDILPPRKIVRPAGSREYFLAWFYDPADIGTRAGEERYPAHTLIVWEPEHPQSYGNENANCRHSWIRIIGTSFRRLLIQSKMPCNIPIHIKDTDMMERYIELIYHEVSRFDPPNQTVLTNLFFAWLIEIRRAYLPPAQENALPDRFLQIKNFLEIHFREPISLDTLAKHGFLSVSYFCSQFKKHLGIPPIEYLIRLRIKEAEYLLEDKNASISDVATKAGFSDTGYFSKLFKKRHGLSPKKYREKLIEGLDE